MWVKQDANKYVNLTTMDEINLEIIATGGRETVAFNYTGNDGLVYELVKIGPLQDTTSGVPDMRKRIEELLSGKIQFLDLTVETHKRQLGMS